MEQAKGQLEEKFALNGGEDYELLFTVKPSAWNKLRQKALEKGFKFQEIGRIVKASEGLKVLGRNGMPIRVKKKGYDHFDK